MTRKSLTNTLIIVGIGLTWALFVALVVWGLMGGEQRVRELGATELERALEIQHTRLSMALQRIEQGLRVEAAFLTAHDSLRDDALIERWQPLLESEWALLSVGVAGENGSDQVLEQLAHGWRLSVAVGGGELALTTEWPLDGRWGDAVPRIGEAMDDPRRSLWFGEALGDRGADPVWSIISVGDTVDLLHVSYLIRSPGPDRPYRVLRFELAPERLLRSLGSKPTTHAEFYVGPRDRPWLLPDTGIEAIAARGALAVWRTGHTTGTIAIEAQGSPCIARINTFNIHGAQLYTGSVLRLEPLTVWTKGERTALWIAAGLLLLLGFLVTWVLLRGRRVDRLAERTEKQSRSQERRLAKAIGEREILDREVHHRVKNNLQVVSSILNLQSGRIADAHAKAEYARGKRRIDSMALVHHKLYAQTDLRNIDLAVFLTQVANAMKAMFEPASRSVSHSVDADSLKLNADTSIQVGIILCELLTNCYQHAFPYVTGGHIEIAVRRDEQDLFRMSVKDNGKGLFRDPDRRELELGLELVEALTEQIDGRLEITVDGGTRVDILFRMQGDGSMRTI